MGDPQGRALVVLALLGAAFLLVVTPVLIGSISILDAGIFEQLQRWFGWSEVVKPYLDLGRLAVVCPLAVIVARASQNT